MPAKILIVEDQYAFMLQELLELYEHFEFEIVKTGDEAMRKLAGPLPDLILLDLRLPGVGGMVVLDAIRKVDSRLPVIIVSAYGDKCTRQEAAERGANHFFQKPVSTMRLYRRIKELLVAAPCRTSSDTPKYRESEVEINREILRTKYRRLFKLKERQALLGIDAPPALLIEIEDLEGEIKNAESL